jgi:hypothetical protein
MNTRISKTQLKNVVKNLTQFIFLIDHDLKSAYTCILILIHFNTAIAKKEKGLWRNSKIVCGMPFLLEILLKIQDIISIRKKLFKDTENAYVSFSYIINI